MAEPDYLDANLTEEQILQRMLDALPADLDKSEGSYIYDALAPVAYELYLVALLAQDVLSKGFASTAASQIAGFRSEYLDRRVEEHGLTRRPAKKASKANGAKFMGTPGTTVPIGTVVATPADAATNTPSIEFVTTSKATLGGDGIGYADIEAVEGGTAGNVPAGAISILVTPMDNITGVTNPEPLAGGLDAESDQALLARYLQRVRNPSSSGNRADYEFWAMEVAGVGAVSVIPVRDGPGTVSIAIVDTNMDPVDQELIDAVQDYIAPPHKTILEAETMTLGGHGASVDDSQLDDTGDSVRFAYDAGGDGTATKALDSALLPQPGIWTARVRIKVDVTSGETDLVQIGVWNVSREEWCHTTPSSSTDAVVTLKGNQLGVAFGDQIVQFYWDGQDQIELRIARLTSDTTTIVWVDRTIFRSAFSKDTGDGKAPVGARVTVEAAGAVKINVSATLTIAGGYDAEAVKDAAEAAIAAYLRSIAFAEDNDVRYARIGEAILGTAGVLDYSNLLVNDSTNNIAVGEQEVAQLGTVIFTV